MTPLKIRTEKEDAMRLEASHFTGRHGGAQGPANGLTRQQGSEWHVKSFVRDLLFPIGVQFNRQNVCVVLEIRIGGKDGPASIQSNRTNESIHRSHGNTSCPACVVRPGGSLMIGSADWLVRKGPHRCSNFFVLSVVPDTGQQFLPDQSDDSNTSFPYEFVEFDNHCLFN